MEDDALTSSDPSATISPTTTSPTNCGSMDQYLPKVIPHCITLAISKQSILQQAIVKLKVELHQIQVTPMNNDDLLGSVCMDVPPHREYPFTSRQEFFGKYTPWKEEAIESACSAALDYLTKVGVLIIEDVNYAELKICKAKLQEAHFWENAFRNRLTSLQENVPKSVPIPRHIDISDQNNTNQQSDANMKTISVSLCDHASAKTPKRALATDGQFGKLDTAWASTSFDGANSGYILPTKTPPSSVSKLPNLKNRVITRPSATRKALFQERCHATDDAHVTSDPTHDTFRVGTSSLKDGTTDLVKKNVT